MRRFPPELREVGGGKGAPRLRRKARGGAKNRMNSGEKSKGNDGLYIYIIIYIYIYTYIHVYLAPSKLR